MDIFIQKRVFVLVMFTHNAAIGVDRESFLAPKHPHFFFSFRFFAPLVCSNNSHKRFIFSVYAYMVMLTVLQTKRLSPTVEIERDFPVMYA